MPFHLSDNERGNMIQLGNCLELMAAYPDQHFDALITDPPYGTTALKFDKLRIDWQAWWREVERITKPHAPIVLFAQQPFTTDLIVSNQKLFRYLLVWQKTMPTGFLDANRRPLRAHEDILVFARQMKGSTYNPQKTQGHKPYKSTNAHEFGHYSNVKDDAVPRESKGERHPTSVLQFSNHNGALWGRTKQVVKHPTAKPIDLMRWLVATYSNADDLVLDCFAGSGTTGVACVQLGRQFVGMELDDTYYQLAVQRVSEATPDLPQSPSTLHP